MKHTRYSSRQIRSAWKLVASAILALSILMIALRATSPVAAADWPGWRGPNRDGKSPDTGLLKRWPPEGPKLLWKATGIGKGYSSVSVVGGRTYTSGDIGDQLVISAYDLNGKLLGRIIHDAAWTTSHPGSRSTPVIDRGNLYIISGQGKIGCYSAKTGKPKWARHASEFGGRAPGWGYAESVLILRNLAVFTPGGDTCIVALDKKTGRTIWTTSGWRAAAQYGGNYAFIHQKVPMIVNGTGAGLACINPNNGRLLWSNPFSAHNTANCPTPVYSHGYVFWANGYGKGGICLKVNVSKKRVTATEAWKTNDMVCHHGGYIVHDGYIYGNHGGGWVCLDLKTGEKMWQARGVGKGSLCYADGMLYLFGENGGQVALATSSPKGMEMRGMFRVEGDGPSWAHPVVINGRLYLRYDTNLYCYDVRAEEAEGQPASNAKE